MAVTYASFIAERPEFSRTAEALIAAKIAEATLRVGAVWGERRDAGISLLTAHLLWSSPFGATTRLEGDRDPKEKSRYWGEFRTMARELGLRFAVT